MIDVVRSIVPLAAVVALAWVPPADARVVTFQASSPIADRSDRALDEAVSRAVDTCVQGAIAMGLASIRLDDAVVRNDRIVLRMVATDDEADEEEEIHVHDLMPQAVAERPR